MDIGDSRIIGGGCGSTRVVCDNREGEELGEEREFRWKLDSETLS